MSRYICTCLLIFLALSCHPAYSQIRISRHIGIAEGLVQSQVTCILEDQEGYMWFGTLGGLSRWDGIQFINYQTQNGLSSPDIRTMAQGDDGALYIGTNGGGINIFRNGVFINLTEETGLPDNTVRSIVISPTKEIILGTDNGVCQLRGDSIVQNTPYSRLDGAFITQIFQTIDGMIYFATNGSGVYCYKDHRLIRIINERIGLPHNKVRAITVAKNGAIYIALLNAGVYVFSNNQVKQLTSQTEWKTRNIRHIYEDTRGTIYLATTGHGIGIYRNGYIETLSRTNGLSHETAWYFYEDGNSHIYIATWAGVDIYENDKFNSFNRQTGLSGNIVLSIAENQKSIFAVGSAQNGYSLHNNGKSFSRESIKKLSGMTIWSLHYDQVGTLRIGTDHGIFQQTEKGIAPIPEDGNFLRNAVYAIHQTQQGELLVGAYDGFFQIRKNRLKLLYRDSIPRRSTIFDIFESRTGRIYLGTRKGALVYQSGVLDTLYRNRVLPEQHIWSIYEDASGTIFFGTNGNGLFLLRNKHYQNITSADGLSDNTVYGIVSDSTGKIYLSTHKGVNVLHFHNDQVEIRHIRRTDGLAGDECNQGAAYTDNHGNLWFGTTNGLTRYDPKKDVRQTTPPQVHITKVRLFEKEIQVDNSVSPPKFLHNENYFKFDYIGINLTAPEKVVYRRRLSGIDKEWVETQGRLVQYTNLDEGDYTFEVKARNDWGYWSNPAALEFTISPPFWRAWWFRLAAFFLIAAILTGIHFYRVRNLLALEKLRIRIASDLHDDIGANLTQIALQADLLGQGIPQKNMHVGLKNLATQSRIVVKSMSDLVWSIDSRNDTLDKLLARMQEFAGNTLAELDIQYEFKCARIDRDTSINIAVRQNLYLIYKEAINNIIKHAGASRVDILLRNDHSGFILSIQDNGIGFSNSSYCTGHGIRNIRMRAEHIKATVSIEKNETGTLIVLLRKKI